MKFDTPATTNPVDQLKVVGKPLDRIDGPRKTTGTARYAYERDDVVPSAAYGHVVGSSIAKGKVVSMDLTAARAAPGVIEIVTARSGQITEVEVYFGWDLPHKAAVGGYVIHANSQTRINSFTRSQ